MVVFDTSVLAIAFDEKAKIPLDPTTGQPITHCRERIDHLLAVLGKAKERILIPAPVLAEYLVRAGADKDKRLQEILTSKIFMVSPFNTRAAVECSQILDGASGSAKPLNENESKAKVKFDRQIIAIAKVERAKRIYTGDRGLAACAAQNAVTVTQTWELPLPPVAPQMELDYPEAGSFGIADPR